MDGVILLVRHGHGRARLPEYFQPILDYLSEKAPDLYAHLRLHRTGTARPNLDDVRAIFFLLADPLREFYPACYAEALELANWARRNRVPVINSPEALSNSIKSVQARLWSEAGIPTPPSWPFTNRDELQEILHRATFPVLIRDDKEHSQKGLHFCRTLREALAVPGSAITYPGLVSQFVDTREGYRASRSGSVWSRFYHKKRSFVIGDMVRPMHLIFSRSPIVGFSSSTLGALKKYPRLLQKIAGRTPRNRQVIQAELDFGFGEAEHPEIMRRAARALDLDFVAFDFSTFADGRVILWEANPYPYMTALGGGTLRRNRRRKERKLAKFACVARFLHSLLDDGVYWGDYDAGLVTSAQSSSTWSSKGL